MARTALLLRTDMSILKDDKMSPLFQEVIHGTVSKKNGYQTKDMDGYYLSMSLCGSIS